MTMMKTQIRDIVIVLLTIVVFFSCAKHTVVKELIQAESLMITSPDSALALLESIPSPEKMSKSDYAEYCLLLTEAQDKNYYKFKSDSVIRVAAEYILSKNNNSLKARTYYMLGRVYHEMMRYERGQENYLQAIPFAKKENNYPLLLRIHNQCGNLYRNRKLYDKALFALHEALKYCRMVDDLNNLPYCLRDIGRVHLLTGETDSTLYYYNKAIDIARINKVRSVESVIYKELGVAYKAAGKYRDAIEAIKRSSNLNTLEQESSLCLTLGSLYLYLNNIDSAAYYLNYAENSTNRYTVAGANYYKYKLAVQTGNYKQAVYLNELYQSKKDSLNMLADKDELLEVIHRFEQEELKTRLEIERVQRERSYLIILLIVITALGGLIIIYYRHRFRKEKELAEQRRQLQNEKNRIATLQRQFREQESILLEQQNQLLQLKEDRRILGDQFFSQTEYKERISLTNPTHMLEESQGLIPFSMKEMNELKEVINLLYNNFTNRLQNQYPLLNNQDIDICCLIKAGAKTRHLANLLCITPDAVTKKKRVISKKTDSFENRMNLSEFLVRF